MVFWRGTDFKSACGKCRNPPPPSRGLPHRLIWAVPHSLLLRSKAEDIQAACELAHRPTTVVDRLLNDFEREAATLRRDVQRELDYGEVEGAGLLWGSNPMEQPPTPRQAPVLTCCQHSVCCTCCSHFTCVIHMCAGNHAD